MEKKNSHSFTRIQMSSGNDFEHVFSEIKDNTLHLKVPTETRADANTVVLQCLQFRKYYL